jgi:hypothetical protein
MPITKRVVNFLAGLGVLALAACATATPTANVRPRPTATLTLTASATATRAPTATKRPTRTPRPSATATPIPQPGDVLLQDTFDSNTQRWGIFNNPRVLIRIFEGAFEITVKEPSIFNFSNPRGDFEDIDLTVDATLAEGTNRNSRFGVQCRKTDNENYYMAAIRGDGYYALVKYIDNEWKWLRTWTRASAIKTDGETNTLRFICSGSTLQLWINGVQTTALHDEAFTHGQVGLWAGTFDGDGPNTKVVFDNLVVKFAEPIK